MKRNLTFSSFILHPSFLQHLNHLSARLGTISARLGTLCHVLVVLERFTGGAALITTFRATFTCGACKPALATCQGRGQPARLCAIDAQLHGHRVVLGPVGDKLHAMMMARIALQGALGADLGAGQHVAVMLAALDSLCRRLGRGRANERQTQGCPSHTQESQRLHGSSSLNNAVVPARTPWAG
jgi:hypothetical protein